MTIRWGAAVFLSAAWALPAGAAAVRMDEVQIEGKVQKPEVVFISERPERVPPHDGVKALRENFLRNTVREARSLAQDKSRD
jgi:hypothetical protein